MPVKRKTGNRTPDSRFKIKICKNGPYAVSGGLPLGEKIIVSDAEGISYAWQEGKKFPLRENYALCRCGQSRNKPFCDGTHQHVNFDGTETANKAPYLEQSREFTGPALDLTDAPALCVHARFCDRAGGIWKLIGESSDPGKRKFAIEEARDCPSGRLVVWEKEGNEIEPEFEPEIILVEDPYEGVSGPLWVRGRITIEAADGTVYEVRNRITLCRCGKSVNKPFCDGSHLPPDWKEKPEKIQAPSQREKGREQATS